MQIFDKYDLRRLANDIYLSGVNLAEDRHDWIVLMRSMAGGGEALRESFLKLASQGSTYKERENQREFTKAMKRSNDDSLAWFLKKAKDLGYKLDDYLSFEGQRAKELWLEKTKRGSPPVLPTIHSSLHTTNSSLKKMNFIPNEYITKCRSNSSVFVRALVSTGILTQEQSERAAELYHLGAMKDGSVIYWQIDEQQRVREGKVMLYGPDCHRLKDHGAQWMGWMMRYKLRDKDGKPLLSQDWQATQCLFGLHLFATENSSLNLVCVVEAEKTAVILSQLRPDALWLAAGGESQLSVEKLAALQGRKVILYPDTDPDGKTFANWQNIATEARRQLGLNISVSDILEKNATPAQKAAKVDLVDLLFNEAKALTPNYSKDLQDLCDSNPAMQDLLDTFGLVEVDN